MTLGRNEEAAKRPGVTASDTGPFFVEGSKRPVRLVAQNSGLYPQGVDWIPSDSTGRGFESLRANLIFDNSNQTTSAHDVAVACCLAMAEVRVQLPLGAFDFRAWESLAFRVLRAHEIAGSNPAVLTDAVVLVLVRAVGCYPS